MDIQVGFAAGKIWNLLKEKGELSLNKVKIELKKKNYNELTVMLALGWLLRENKISFLETKRGRSSSYTVSLK